MRPIDADKISLPVSDTRKTGWDYGILYAKSEIDRQPTLDDVPVVRCKDCGNHSESNGNHYCKFWRMYCPDDSDFFCKAGKRKDGA